MVNATPPPPLLSYTFANLPDPLQVSTAASLSLTVDNQTGGIITCQQIVVTLPVGTNAKDLIAGAGVEAVPAPGWTSVVTGGVIVFTAPGGSVAIKGAGLVFVLAVTVNDQPGAATVTVAETAANAANPMAQRSTSWAAAKFPIDFSLSALTAVPLGNTDILYGSPAELNWTATGTGVTCTLDYQPANGGAPVSVAVPNSPVGGSYTTVPLTRTDSVTFSLVAQVSVPGQDEPLTRQHQLTVTVETLSLTVTVQPLTIPPGGIAMISWDAPNAVKCITKDGETLPPSGTAYVVLQQSHDFTMTAYGNSGQTRQAPAFVTVDPTIRPTEAGHTVTGPTGPTAPPGLPVTVAINADSTGTISFDGTVIPFQATRNSFTVTIDGVTRPPTPADVAAFMQVTCPPAGQGPAGLLEMALPPLDLTGTSGRVIPISVTGGTGDTGCPGSFFTVTTPGQTGPWGFQGPGGPGGKGGNALAVITPDSTQTTAQYIFTFAPGAGGAGGAGEYWTGAPGPSGTTSVLVFGGLVVPLDGSLVTPVPFVPLVLTVTAIPPTVPMNGLALVSWQSPNADHCILWDGSVVPPNGERYMVMTATTECQVTAFDNLGRTTPGSATITVDPSIKPTEPGTTQTGATGGAGAAGTCPQWTVNFNGSVPSGWTEGDTGGTGGDAPVTLTIPPLDTTGTSTRVIPITATAGAGGPGGTGGYLIAIDAPPPYPSPQPVQFYQWTAAPGGPGGPGGSATVTLTIDPSQAPARIILNAGAGIGGAGGESGWRYDFQGNNMTSYAANGANGAATVTVDGTPVVLPPPSSSSEG